MFILKVKKMLLTLTKINLFLYISKLLVIKTTNSNNTKKVTCLKIITIFLSILICIVWLY